MNIGKARALFEQVASGEYHGNTVGEYLEAVKIVLDMETHNSISKKMIISVCKWLVEIAEKAVSPYRWIPVSERLPEDTQYVLLTVRRLNNAYNSTPFISVGYIGWNQQRWWCAHDGDCEISKVEVLAWMPLPEAYKPNK